MRDLPLFQRVKALQQQLTSAQDGKKQRDQYQYRSHAERIKHPKCGADFVLRHEAEAGKVSCAAQPLGLGRRAAELDSTVNNHHMSCSQLRSCIDTVCLKSTG